MNALELWRLRKFCEQHELDYQLVDLTLTYSENKKYLASQVADFNPENRLDEWKSQEEYYMKHHFLMFYINCMREGATKSEETGEPIQPNHFSLAEWIKQNSHSLSLLLGCLADCFCRKIRLELWSGQPPLDTLLCFGVKFILPFFCLSVGV
jgi:hypothetical protein